jgi:ABC-2 type transport system permease protein
MQTNYSQMKAMLAITKGSLTGIVRSPSAVVFSFIFPFIFILVFGFIGNSGGVPVYKIVTAANCDTANALYDSIKASNRIRIVKYNSKEALDKDLAKGKIAGVLSIQKTGTAVPPYTYSISSTNASSDQWPQLLSLLSSISSKVSDAAFANRPSYAVPDFNYTRDIKEIREYRTIDFILPGQLGFSLLSTGVFGVAFVFFGLRNTLVLKRYFATPIKRTYILLGEALARVIFQMIAAVVIILVGYFAFDFTLVHGVQTLFEMLFLSFLGLLVFMGFGFIISGLAKNDSSIPPFANLITMPQFLLGGTFFAVEVFPKWLQPVSKALPLTHLNTAMRAVAFEGQSLWAIKSEIGILVLWGIVVYAVAIKVFRWE